MSRKDLIRENDALRNCILEWQAWHANVQGQYLEFEKTIREEMPVIETRLTDLDDALQGLVDAVASMRVPQTIEEAALQITLTIGPALAAAQEVLKRGQSGD